MGECVCTYACHVPCSVVLPFILNFILSAVAPNLGQDQLILSLTFLYFVTLSILSATSHTRWQSQLSVVAFLKPWNIWDWPFQMGLGEEGVDYLALKGKNRVHLYPEPRLWYGGTAANCGLLES